MGYPGPTGPFLNPTGNLVIPADWATRIAGGQQVAGITKTSGVVGQTVEVQTGWTPTKMGIANTVGNNPIPHTAAYSAIASLAPVCKWFYNYSVTPWSYVTGPNGTSQAAMTDPGPALGLPMGVQFVPMFYNINHVNAQEIAWAQPWAQLSGHIITGNEPYGETANTTDQWIAVWPQVQAMADAVGARIVAPSIGWGGTSAQNWLVDFMNKIAANGYRVDVLNFHATLGSVNGTADPVAHAKILLSALDSMRAAFPTKPVWVTEYEFFTTHIEQLAPYYDYALAGFEARQWVERTFAWPLGTDPVIYPGDVISLVDFSGQLTAAGQLYLSYAIQ